MTTPISVLDNIAMRVWVQDTEQASVNTFHFHVTSVTGNPSLDTMVTQFDQAIETEFKAVLYNGADYRGVQAILMNKLPPPVPVVSTGFEGVGTGGAVGLPRQAAAIITWYTIYRGSRYRGRTFWPFPPSGADDGFGKVNAAAITAYETLATNIQTFTTFGSGGNTGTCVFSIWSEKYSTMQTVESFLQRNTWGTLKKRGSYGRPNNSPI